MSGVFTEPSAFELHWLVSFALASVKSGLTAARGEHLQGKLVELEIWQKWCIPKKVFKLIFLSVCTCCLCFSEFTDNLTPCCLQVPVTAVNYSTDVSPIPGWFEEEECCFSGRFRTFPTNYCLICQLRDDLQTGVNPGAAAISSGAERL